MMNTLLTYLLESTICLGIFYLFYVVVLRSQSSYQYNRFYLLGTSFVSFIFPLLEIPLYISNAGSIAGTYEGYLLLNPAEVTQAERIAVPSPDWTLVLGTIYLVGFSIALFLFLQQLYRLCQLIRKGTTQSTCQGDYQLVYTHGKLPASSFFHYLFWDNTCTLKIHEQQQILAHEEVHIRQRHSYDVLYMSLLRIIFWFNPLVYLYDKALTETHEFAADAGVLKRIPPKEYASLLTRRLFEGLDMSLVNHFYKSRTLKRIKMMEAINKKTPWYKFALAAPLVAVVFFTFSCQEESEMSKLDTLSEQYKNAKTDEERDALSDANETFMVVEEQPEPEGGIQAFYKYVSENLKYPAEARQKGVEGKVFVQFVVDTDGSLTEVKALKGIGSGCDEEAVRVLKEAPAWNPGKQRGQFVKVRMVMPITFKLNEGDPKAEADNIKGDQGEMNVQVNTQGNTVKGTVLSEDGNPVAGANVLIKGTSRGTVTDRDGNFSLQLQGEGNEQELAISHMSYQLKQVRLL